MRKVEALNHFIHKIVKYKPILSIRSYSQNPVEKPSNSIFRGSFKYKKSTFNNEEKHR
jgi:hypothetical protein